MGKIYIKEDLNTRTGEKKKKDDKRRTRNVTINFHVTAEEKSLIEQRIALSGLSKSDFFIQSTINQKIVIYGNIRVYDRMQKDMKVILEKLSDPDDMNYLQPETEMKLITLCDMLQGWDQKTKKEEYGFTEKEGSI